MQTTMARWMGMTLAAIVVAMTAGAADTYELDPVHSTPIFKIGHMGVSNTIGRFNDVSGSFTVDEADPSKNSIEVVIKTASVDTGNEARDGHLRTADFLDAETYPEMTFKSASFEKTGEKTYKVKGDLTLHGVTKTVEVDAVLVGSGKGREGETRMGWETTFTIKRSDYGMTNMIGPVGDEVEITFAVEGVNK